MGDEFTLQNYVVAFLDVMGQKNQLQLLDRLPANDEEVQTAIGVLRNTLGVVLDIRTKFRDFVEKYRDLLLDDSTGLPEELRGQVRDRLKTFDIGFSDSFVLAVPLEDPDRPDLALIAIRSVIAAVGAMMLDALSLGRAIRGGLDLGLGVRLESGELYGPALLRPYTLENNDADYPRVVVGATLREFLEGHAMSAPTTDAEGLAQVMAAKSLQKTGMDRDGLLIVDYLGQAFVPPPGGQDMRAHVAKALAFAERERDRFLKKGHTKLAGRYSRLVDYIQSRLPLWELSSGDA